MLGSLNQACSGSGVQVVLQRRVYKASRSHANRGSVLTMLLEDPGDCFMHMLLQFGTVEAEAALEGDQTNRLC